MQVVRWSAATAEREATSWKQLEHTSCQLSDAEVVVLITRDAIRQRARKGRYRCTDDTCSGSSNAIYGNGPLNEGLGLGLGVLMISPSVDDGPVRTKMCAWAYGHTKRVRQFTLCTAAHSPAQAHSAV